MEHVHSEHVAAEPDAVFAVLRDPQSLARFVPQLTRVDQQGERVEVEARYQGRTQHGDAFFTTDEDARRIEWGTDSGYRGWLEVQPDESDGSMLTLGLHTTHVEHADHDVAGTLDAIRRLVEAEV
jgi:polyketide cyclase/dehydrase/lipid transport protein